MHTYPAGTVFLGVVWDPWAWQLVLDGKLRGFSIGGKAERILADIPAPDVAKAMEPVAKHPGHPDQKVHAGRRGPGMESADIASAKGALGKRGASLAYNESYDQALEGLSGKVDLTPMVANRTASLQGRLTEFRAATPGSDLHQSLAEVTLNHQGFIDGATGAKRQVKRMLFSGEMTGGYTLAVGPWGKAAEPVVKHPGHPDQKVHAGGKGRLSTVSSDGVDSGPRGATPRRGMGDTSVSDEDYAALAQGSAGAHLVGRRPDGSPVFTPERQALHDKYVSEQLDGIPTSSDPTFHMLGGGPAAGKSTMLNSGGVDVPGKGKAAQINADDAKEALPEYRAMTAARDPRAAAFAHEESSYLAKRVQAAALERRVDVVLDGTGDSSPESVMGKVGKARGHGYKVNAHYATVPTDMAVERATARGLKTGRVVPETVIRGTHKSVSQVFPQVHHTFDQVNLYDTSSGASLIASGAGGRLTVHDKDAYAAFLAKGD
jgi:predicted ABC-type ATPase